MKKISVWFLILIFAASLASAQETATQQQIDKLSGQIQDMLEAQAQQGKRLDALEKEISDLRDRVSTPVVTDYATHAELKALAEQAQEIDRKRQEDTGNIANQLAALARTAAAVPSTPSHVRSPDRAEKPDDNSASGKPEDGYYYEVKQGDNLGLIIKAYRQKGVKVTKSQIIAANPKMNPDVLIPGKKIFIPDPSAK